jgi:hypothetical protein
MTFDQWIDAVDAQVRGRLGRAVRTEELSWDSAMWVGGQGTVVAALQDDEATAKLSFDAGDSLSVNLAETRPEAVAGTIVERLGSRTA